jgi:2-aminoadipate transaminase
MYRYAQRMELAQPSFIRESLKLASDPTLICFAGGNPDPAYFPWEELAQAAQRAITGDWRTALQYSVTEGNLALRESLRGMMKAIGIDTPVEQLVITSGSQQGLDLVAKAFLDKGDKVIVESPTYMGAVNAIKYYQPQFLEVETDQDGMRMDALERVLQGNPDAKFIYTIPDFQNPTGQVLARERRSRMIALAEQYDVMIVEDNPYYYLRYDGEAIPPVKHFDDKDRVIYLGSTSKILCPALRIGWIIAPRHVVNSLVYLKQACDLQTSELTQRIAGEYLARNDIMAHIARMNGLYKKKKDRMLQAIRDTFPPEIQYTVPQGGLFLWLTFPEEVDALALFHQMKESIRVIFVPGDTFYPYGGHPNTARLSFATVSEEQIGEGMERMGGMLTQLLHQ